MAFCELELKRIDNAVGALCKRRTRPQLADRLQFVYEVDGQSVVIFEECPDWRDPAKRVRNPVAKFRFLRSTGLWTLYRRRADQKWHAYQPAEPTTDLAALVGVVERDATARSSARGSKQTAPSRRTAALRDSCYLLDCMIGVHAEVNGDDQKREADREQKSAEDEADTPQEGNRATREQKGTDQAGQRADLSDPPRARRRHGGKHCEHGSSRIVVSGCALLFPATYRWQPRRSLRTRPLRRLRGSLRCRLGVGRDRPRDLSFSAAPGTRLLANARATCYGDRGARGRRR